MDRLRYKASLLNLIVFDYPLIYRSLNICKSLDPNPPQNLTSTASTSSTINLTWTSPTAIFSGYELFISDSDSGALVSHRNLTNSTSYQAKDLEPNSAYRFAVKTVSNGSYSSTASELSREATAHTRKFNHIVPETCTSEYASV